MIRTLKHQRERKYRIVFFLCGPYIAEDFFKFFEPLLSITGKILMWHAHRYIICSWRVLPVWQVNARQGKQKGTSAFSGVFHPDLLLVPDSVIACVWLSSTPVRPARHSSQIRRGNISSDSTSLLWTSAYCCWVCQSTILLKLQSWCQYLANPNQHALMIVVPNEATFEFPRMQWQGSATASTTWSLESVTITFVYKKKTKKYGHLSRAVWETSQKFHFPL